MSERVFSELKDFLESNEADYKLIPQAHFGTPLDSVVAAGYSPAQIVKSLLLKSGASFQLGVLSLTDRIDSRKFKQIIGSNSLRFATAEELQSVTGCEPGACHPFGVMDDIKTTVDESVQPYDEIVFSPGIQTASIAIRLTDYIRIASPTIAKIKLD